MEQFRLLSAARPELAAWFRKERKRPRKLRPFDFRSPEEVQSTLLDRVDPSAPELGYSLAVWNGDTGGWEATYSMTVGLYSQAAGLTNRIVVSLRSEGGPRIELGTTVELLRGMIAIWQPDTGSVFSLGPVPFDEAVALEPERTVYASYDAKWGGGPSDGILIRTDAVEGFDDG